MLSINTIINNSGNENVQKIKRYTLTLVDSIDRILPDEGYNSMACVKCRVDVIY